uniref:Uncharacterized protein n=1 Tax=Oryza nivara TaxID=4536 RepID=A0A0E0HQY8_ORYNI
MGVGVTEGGGGWRVRWAGVGVGIWNDEASSTTTGACLSSAHGLHRLPFRRRRSAPRWRAIRRSQRPSPSSAAAVPPSSAGGLQIATIAHARCPHPPPVEDAEELLVRAKEEEGRRRLRSFTSDTTDNPELVCVIEVYITHERNSGQSENPDATSMQMRIILTTMYIETFIVQSIGTNPCSWCRSLLTAKLNFSLDLNDIRVISEDIGSLRINETNPTIIHLLRE